MTMSPFSLIVSSLSAKDKLKWVHTFVNHGENKMKTFGPSPPYDLSAMSFTSALNVLLCSHSRLKTIFPNLQQYLVEGMNPKWVDNYMEDSMKLLDMCREISENIEEVKRYQTLLHTTTRHLDRIEFCNNHKQSHLVKAINMLENCMHAINVDNTFMRKRNSRWRPCPSLSRLQVDCRMEESTSTELLKDISIIMDFTKLFLRILSKSLSVKLPRTCLAQHLRNSHHLVSVCSAMKVLRRRFKGSCAVLHELQMADITVTRLHNLLKKQMQCKGIAAVEIKELVENLRKCNVELEKCIDPLHEKINALYAVLMNSRVALLDILTWSNV
ncbi:hypothetical protein KI387_007485 [Taxus chinensis]|uniref:Uncharacterized protein n=1 Tax=Taxus chinensis TaxID=29808 RepID=A0AA38LN32_TAXCH|nr:hypothetical protein KI387_007485 [Taxus chinensis]